MITQTEHNQYLLLDGVIGWRDKTLDAISLTTPDRDLGLETLPGKAVLAWKDQQAAALVCPWAIAPERCGGDTLLVLDAARDRIQRIDTRIGRFELLRAIGGHGGEARQFSAPRGIVALPSGAIAVSDTGNHRVQLFSPPPYAVRAIFGRADNSPGSAPGEFNRPWGIALSPNGALYVADRGNHRVQRLALDGTQPVILGAGLLQDPTEIAVAPDGSVAVVDASTKQNAVVVFPADGTRPRVITAISGVRSVAFDPLGDLFAGDGHGLIYKMAPNRSTWQGYTLYGAGVTGLDAAAVHLRWWKSDKLLAVFREPALNNRPRIWFVPPAGAVRQKGKYVTQALDSGIEDCVWHRVALSATIPQGGSIEIESLTGPDPNQDVSAFDQGVRCLLAGPDDAPECLIQSDPGRYLWLRISLASNGDASPQVHSLKAYYPRQSYLQYLPAVYQEDAGSRRFLDRFLSIFQTSFDAFDNAIDNIWKLFDPGAVPENNFLWLAAWLALTIDPSWDLPKRRKMLQAAFQRYLRRGTPDGLSQAIEDYANTTATVIEHFRLRRFAGLNTTAELNGGARLFSRSVFNKLQIGEHSQVGAFQLGGAPEPALEPIAWGAHQFTVFFQADPYDYGALQKSVGAVVDREKPAHTQAVLCPVFPRARVGVQATVGVDTYVGAVSNLVLSSLATLGYDSILACSAPEHQVRRLGSAVQPRVGETTQVL